MSPGRVDKVSAPAESGRLHSPPLPKRCEVQDVDGMARLQQDPVAGTRQHTAVRTPFEGKWLFADPLPQLRIDFADRNPACLVHESLKRGRGPRMEVVYLLKMRHGSIDRLGVDSETSFKGTKDA